MEKTIKALRGAMWGIIASAIVSFELVVVVVASGPNPAGQIIHVITWSYLVSCFLAGLITEKVNGAVFGTGFDIALGITFKLTLWRGENSVAASLLGAGVAFAGTIVGVVLRWISNWRSAHRKRRVPQRQAPQRRKPHFVWSPLKP